MTTFQPFYDLPAAQYEAFKADIAQRGIVVPIVVDEDGTVIDGHQRRRACAELHVDCPQMVVDGLTEDEKKSLAIALNAFRRQLSGTERSQAIHKLRSLGMSTRQIAAQVGISQPAVVKQLAGTGDNRLSPVPVDPDTGEITEPETVTGSDGNSYPARRDPSRIASRRADVKELHDAGSTERSIATQLGVGRATVRKDLVALGIRGAWDDGKGRRRRGQQAAREVNRFLTQLAALSHVLPRIDVSSLDWGLINVDQSEFAEHSRVITVFIRDFRKEMDSHVRPDS